jgi:hypothetical protein
MKQSQNERLIAIIAILVLGFLFFKLFTVEDSKQNTIVPLIVLCILATQIFAMIMSLKNGEKRPFKWDIISIVSLLIMFAILIT